MKTLLRTQFHKMIAVLSERWHLVLENLALLHQIAVLERSAKRPQFSSADRLFWMLLSQMWPRWQGTLKIVQADTVRRWRRQGFRQLLEWCRRQTRPGRPPIPGETRALIRQMSRENSLWGAPRIHSELALLDIRVSRTTVAKYMDRRPGSPSQTWRTFWHNHVPHLSDIIPSTERIQHFQALSDQVVQAIRRWFTVMVASFIRRDLGRPALVSTRPNAITPVLRVWGPQFIDRVKALERSPPAPIASIQQDGSAKNQSLDTLTSEVWLPSSVLVRRDRCPLLQRRSRHHAADQGRGLAQRKAA